MFRIQSGPRLAAGASIKLQRPFANAAFATCATLCTALTPLLTPLLMPFAANAQAQPKMQQARQASDQRADPLNAQASVPPLLHESAFAQYRRLTDVQVGSWRDANDTVTRIGGWRAYAREAAQPAPPAAPVPAASASPPGIKPSEPAKAMPMPMPGGKDPHGGHKMN